MSLFGHAVNDRNVSLGYAVAPAEVVAELDRAVLPYHLSTLTQAAGRLALKYRTDAASASYWASRREAGVIDSRYSGSSHHV